MNIVFNAAAAILTFAATAAHAQQPPSEVPAREAPAVAVAASKGLPALRATLRGFLTSTLGYS